MKRILFLIGVVLISSCGSNEAVQTAEVEEKIVEEEIPIDSAAVFIQDSLIYSVMTIFLDSLPGGSDSNIIMPFPHIPEFSKVKFEYSPRDPEVQYLDFNMGKPRDNFSGFGVSYFEGDSEDSIYLKQQIEHYSGKKWLAQKFRALEYDSTMLMKYVTDDSFDWEAFEKDGFGCFSTYGLPLFNKDQNRCIISLGYSCHGTIAGGSVNFLEKKRGIWYIVGCVYEWVS